MAMKKTPMTFTEAFAETMRHLGGPGVLLSGLGADGKANTMTIGWATFGIVWGRPIASVFVRPSRHTYSCMEATPDFSINVLPEAMRDALNVCGTKSGRDIDKFAECGLTLAPAEQIRTPVIEQAILCYECKTQQWVDLVPSQIAPSIVESYYPRGDFHRIYHGEIVACYASSP